MLSSDFSIPARHGMGPYGHRPRAHERDRGVARASFVYLRVARVCHGFYSERGSACLSYDADTLQDHVRDCFCNAIDAFADWNEGEPEPTVEFEVNYVPRLIKISKACGLVWNCTDILPRLAISQLEDVSVEFKRQTYAAAAHGMLENIRSNAA